MPKHKAPTQVTIASIQEKTLFHELVERHWKTASVVVLAVAGAVVARTYLRRQSLQSHVSVWDELRGQAGLGGWGGVQGGSVESLAAFAEQNQDSVVGGWAKALEVGERVEANTLSEAEKAASQLESQWPDHFLAKVKLPQAKGEPKPLSLAIREGQASLGAWEKEHANLFSNPPLPADAPRVRLNTSKGPIVVGLYIDRAPKHAENFLARCKEGAYTGTKFHKVVRGSLVQGGDPNSASGEPDSWGLGGEAEALEPELDPRLRHFKGALVAWKGPAETRSHGSQFFLTTADQNAMDGKTVVFGMVLEGMATLETIESGAVVGDRPQDPATIESVEVL